MRIPVVVEGPEIVLSFFNPVSGILFGAGPTVAVLGEPRHEGIDWKFAGCGGFLGRVSCILVNE